MRDTPVIRAFIARSQIKQFPAKHRLLHAGNQSRSLFLVLHGSVCVSHEESDGREVVLSYLNPGEFFGETCLADGDEDDGSHREEIVRTRCATVVAECDLYSFRSLVAAQPEILLEVTAQLARRLREASQRVGDFAFLDVPNRLEHTLRTLSRKPDAVPHPQGTVVRISRIELARHIGCSRESAGRALKKLSQERVVRTRGRTILVCGVPDESPVADAA